MVACTSLHHVGDVDAVLDKIESALAATGVLVVIEWAWEQVDERTATWCFERLNGVREAGWLHQRREGWRGSGLPWREYFAGWAENHGLHRSDELLRQIDQRFACQHASEGPFFFPDLDGVSEADEQAAIDGGAINATARTYVGRLLER